MEKLNKTFIEQQILEAEELNEVTSKIDELVEGSNAQERTNIETSDKLNQLASNVDELRNEIEGGGKLVPIDLTSQVTDAYYYETNGTTIPTTPVLHGGFCNLILTDIERGSKITIKGMGGTAPQLWAFYDANGNKTRDCGGFANYTTDTEIEVAQNEKTAIFNFNKSADYKLVYQKYVTNRENLLKNIEEIIYKEKDLTDALVVGYYYDTGNSVAIPTTRGTQVSFCCAKFTDLKKGTFFSLSGKGGAGARMWAFYDANGNKTRIADIDATESNLELEVAENEKVAIFNFNIQTPYNVVSREPLSIKTTLVSKDYTSERLRGFTYFTNNYATLPTTLETHGDYDSLRIDNLVSGATIAVKGMGGNAPRLWAFYDADGNRTRIQTTNIGMLDNVVLNVRENEKTIIVNVNNHIAMSIVYTYPLTEIEVYDAVDKLANNDALAHNKSYQFGKTCDCDFTCPSIESMAGKDVRNLNYWYGLYDALVSAYPNYVSKVNCDTEMVASGIPKPSYMDGYPIYMYKFIPPYAPHSHNFSDTETEATRLKVFIVSGTHEEHLGVYATYHTMRLICESWATDKNLEELRWNCEFYVIPCSGPYEIVNFSRKNANGVDLNRNCPTKNWVVSGSPTDTTWGGSVAGSEYETKVLMHYMQTIKPSVFIDHHNCNKSDGKNLIYITTKAQSGVDCAAALISQMTRKWKHKYQSIFPQDDAVIYGYAKRASEMGIRCIYGHEQGALSFTYECNQDLLYTNGVYDATNYHSLTTEVCTMAVEGFINFVVRVLCYVSGR